MCECCTNIVVKFDNVEDLHVSSTDGSKRLNSEHVRSTQTHSQLLLGKDGAKIVRINRGIITSPLFRVDIPSSSESIRFGTQMARMETDNKIEGGKELGPVHLTPSGNLSSSEVLKIFVIGNDINQVACTLKVMMPSFKSFADC